jgi:predicted dehydrogenase
LEAAENAFHGQVKLSADYHPYLNDPEIDAFALAIQTEPSFEIAKQIMQAGKHLFIEKPMAENTEKAIILNRIAKEKKVVLHVDHIMLFHPIIRRIKQMYDEGTRRSDLF